MREKLDLRGEVCPFTFVKTKLKLETLNSGDILEVYLDYEPATRNVPRSLKAEGHEVLELKQIGDGEWLLKVRKA
jgi:tRNA 2-thiouridine synthesizing protein A